MGAAVGVFDEWKKNNPGGRGLGKPGEVTAQPGLGPGYSSRGAGHMLSRILFQADWRQECVLCYRNNVPSDRTANREDEERNVRSVVVAVCFPAGVFSLPSLSHMYFWLANLDSG